VRRLVNSIRLEDLCGDLRRLVRHHLLPVARYPTASLEVWNTSSSCCPHCFASGTREEAPCTGSEGDRLRGVRRDESRRPSLPHEEACREATTTSSSVAALTVRTMEPRVATSQITGVWLCRGHALPVQVGRSILIPDATVRLSLTAPLTPSRDRTGCPRRPVFGSCCPCAVSRPWAGRTSSAAPHRGGFGPHPVTRKRERSE